ncbi:hypothetical protein G9A89_005205 [Geosiphon pyriformis]|nr:hypothetical protein G9A89_005205 [Geosiphon pyriformis]
MDKSRLAVAGRSSFSPLSGHSVSVKSGFSLKIKPSLLVTIEVNDRFAILEHSFISLDHGTDVVISENLGVFISDKTVAEAVSFDVSLVSKLEDSIRCLMKMVLGLLAKVNSLGADAIAVNAAMFSDDFVVSKHFLDLDVMWNIVYKVFKKKWFRDYDSIFTNETSKFHKLEILVSKIAKSLHKGIGALPVRILVDFGASLDCVHLALFSVVLDYLVVENELILEPNLVKAKSLEYVFDDAFLSIMCSISFGELFGVVSNLPDGKAPSLAKVHLDICFFANLVLKKAISDKQFLYLVLVVLYPIQYNIVFVKQLHNHYSDVFDWYIFKCWKRLDSHGLVLECFKLSAVFLTGSPSFSTPLMVLSSIGLLSIFDFNDYVSVCKHLFWVDTGSLFVYTDRSLKGLDTVGCKAGIAAFFEDINLSLGISVLGLMSYTLAEMQAIALALECVLLSSSVYLYLDSQSVLNACSLELNLVHSDFHNWC